jgi:hypothetical protein
LAKPKWLTSIVEQNVSRFDIAMEHSAAMSVFDSTRDFCHELHTFWGGVLERRRVLLQASLLRELHTEKRQAVLAFAHFINRKNVRVIQTGHRLCFSSEPLQRFVRISAITKNAFYCDDAPGMSLPCAIDHAHAAATDLLENFVISQEPRLMGDVHFGENILIQGLRYPVTAFQSIAQEATHANSAVEAHGCSTLLAFCVLFCSARKPLGVSF